MLKKFVLAFIAIFSMAVGSHAQSIINTSEVGLDGKGHPFGSSLTTVDYGSYFGTGKYIRVRDIGNGSVSKGEFALGLPVGKMANTAFKFSIGASTDRDVLFIGSATSSLYQRSLSYNIEGRVSTTKGLDNTLDQTLAFGLLPSNRFQMVAQSYQIGRTESHLRFGVQYNKVHRTTTYFAEPFYDPIVETVGVRGGITFKIR